MAPPGKISEKLRGLVEVAHVVQRDMMAMPLAPRGRTPFSPDLDRLASGYGDVTCGTGDSFVTSSDPWLNENNINIVDMELFAIAHVSQRHSVRWRAFKFITDDANDSPPNTGPPMSPTDRSCSGMR
jgi:adenosylhomocysteine nucleosidase